MTRVRNVDDALRPGKNGEAEIAEGMDRGFRIERFTFSRVGAVIYDAVEFANNKPIIKTDEMRVASCLYRRFRVFEPWRLCAA